MRQGSAKNKLTVNKCEKEGCNVAHKKRPAEFNQILAGVVCAVGFCMIVITVLVDSFGDKSYRRDYGRIVASDDSDQIGCEIRSCEIICRGISLNKYNVSKLIEDMYTKINMTKCEESVSVKFESLTVEDDTLREHWLESNNVVLRRIRISGENIKRIDNRAFHGKVFYKNQHLELERKTFDDWNETFFAGMPNLQTLYLIQCTFLSIQPNVLRPLAPTLTTLQIIQTTHTLDPINITGTAYLDKLEILDLRYNGHGIELNSKTFKGLRFCKSIYLQQSSLIQIRESTFASMKYLRKLHLSQNQLVSLSRLSFELEDMDIELEVDLNPWRCDCDLQWLKEYLIAKPPDTNPLCDQPCEGCSFSEVDFCAEPIPNTTKPPDTSSTIQGQNMTTTGLSSTQMLTTSHIIETTINENLIDLLCTNGVLFEEAGSLDGNYFQSRKLMAERIDTQIPNQTVDFNIQDNGPGFIKINVRSELKEEDLLIWFSNHIGYDIMNISKSIGCAMNLTNNIPISNLNAGETYSFCFMKGNERKITPLNCRAHIVELPWSLKAWLFNNERPLVLSILSAGLVACCIFGAIVIYCLIRRHPTLLRGSKRVVMVKHKNTDAIVLPASFCESDLKEREQSWHQKSFGPSSTFGKSPFRRSVSEQSIASMKSVDASYVSAAEPTTAQLQNWRLERLRMRMQEKEHRSLPITSPPTLSPPPLPPPNVASRPHSPSLTSHYESIENITIQEKL